MVQVISKFCEVATLQLFSFMVGLIGYFMDASYSGFGESGWECATLSIN